MDLKPDTVHLAPMNQIINAYKSPKGIDSNSQGQRPWKPISNLRSTLKGVVLFVRYGCATPFGVGVHSEHYPGALPPAIHLYPLRGHSTWRTEQCGPQASVSELRLF